MTRFSNINGLLAFVTVVKEGNVCAAADVLNLTQPAVSHQLKRLSEDINVSLFTRASHGLRLTPEGEQLYKKAESAVNAVAEFHQAAQKQSSLITGKLIIGTIVDPAFIRLGDLLSQLQNEYPQIETQLIHGVSGETLQRLNKGQINAGFYLSAAEGSDPLITSNSEPLFIDQLAEFNYTVIAPSGWDAKINAANWPDLAKLPWIGTPELSVHNRLLQPIFEKHNCAPNIVAQVDQEASMLEMVRAGVGLCLCRESIALEHHHTWGLSVCRDIQIPARLNFLAPQKELNTPLHQAFIKTLQNIWSLNDTKML